MKKSTIISFVIVALAIGFMVGLETLPYPLLDEQPSDRSKSTGSSGHDHHSHKTSNNKGHPQAVEVKSPVPKVSLEVAEKIENGGLRIQVQTQNFVFQAADDISDAVHVGHAHLSVDGKMKVMFYRPVFSFENLSPGEHVLRVTLSNRSHAELLHEGEPIGDTIQVRVEG